MKKLVILIFLIVLSACNSQTEKDLTSGLMYDQLERPANTEYYHMPLGLCEDWPEEPTTREIYVNDFELLKRSGIKYLRISFGWDAIEGEKDKYDWLFWDDFVKTGVEDYGITMIPYICYTPAWQSTEPADSFYYWNKPAKDFNEFGEFMHDLVARYKPWIKTWELWNEPDISIYWSTQDVGEFARFTKIGAEAVKKADPSAKVVLGGIAYRPEWIQQLFEDHGVSPYVDIVNCHNYFETWHEKPVEEIVDYVNDVYETVHKYGDGQPIWMAEVGYSTFRAPNGKISDSYWAYYDYEHTPEYQAIDLVKRVALVRSTDQIDAMAWYEIKDLPPSDEVIGDIYNNKHLGIAYADHSPKPANHALIFVNNMLKDPVKNINGETTVDKKKDSDSHVLAFERENGDVILFAWLQTVDYSIRKKEEDGNKKDKRIEKINITISKKLSGTPALFNELGEKQELIGYSAGENDSKIKSLELVGGKISVIEIKK